MVKGNKSDSFSAHGSEKGGIKGSRKGIKHGHQGRNLQDTEHHERMEHELGSHPANPSGEMGIY